MKLIVGLGNPGEKYEGTRHNLGFMVLERFFKDFESVNQTNWSEEVHLKGDAATLLWKPKKGSEEKVILLRPKTYMNNSGQAVSLAALYYKIRPEDIWIVYDELDLPLGAMKIRFGGAGAGHKGIESIIGALGTDKFWRFRMGIGVSRNHAEIAKHRITNTDEFVLGKFGRGEAGKTRELIKRGAKAITTALESGLESAMNRFNTR